MTLRLIATLVLALTLNWSIEARADNIEITHIALEANDDGYALDADFHVDLQPRLEDAINKGVPLYFEIEFEVTRSRWYWLDERPASRQMTLRLSYHALTRQYRLARGALHQSFSSLPEALRVLSRVRSWQVLDRAEISAGTEYQAALRMRLDLTQLPKPFQLNALTNREWNLSSDWRRWPFYTKAPVTEKVPK